MTDEIIVFTISGDWAHFKRPYTTTSPLTFDLPPPPTILGVIGAIIGLDKSQYLAELAQHCRVSVTLRGSPRKLKTGIKLLDSQASAGSFRGIVKDSATGFLTTRDNPTAPIEVELLSEVSYNIFCLLQRNDLMAVLKERLQERRPYYGVSLGLAWCLADFEYVGSFSSDIVLPNDEVSVLGWLPQSAIATPKLEPGKRYHMMTMPITMMPDRVVTTFKDMIYEFSGKTIRCMLKGDVKLWRMNDDGEFGEGAERYVYLV